MTQNNERELLVKIKYAICMAIYSDDGLDGLEGENLMKEIDKYLSPISQNEHQEAVAWVVKIPESRRGCSNDIVFYYKMSEMLKEHILAGDDVTPLYASPPKQIPDGWKPSEKEILKYASEEELFLFADESDLLAIADGILELVQIKIKASPTTSLTSETNTEVVE